MFEMIINPKKAEKRPWEMFFVGLFYASLSVLLVNWIFSSDPVLLKYSGVLVVTFTVMFTLPFMYYLFRLEEEKDIRVEGFRRVILMHSAALKTFLWLFLGYILAYTLLHILLPNEFLFKAQIQTYCSINSPSNIDSCVAQYDATKKGIDFVSGSASSHFLRFLAILENNTYVLIFTLLFSLIFGAGAIFVLAWNASVIAAAIGIFAQYQIENIPFGVARYMIHGFPEIAAYFIAALAGGIVSVGVIRFGVKDRRFYQLISHASLLLAAALLVLIAAGLVEVYITPQLF